MNGLNLNVSEDDFKSKEPSEQSWMIFKAVEMIDQHGCKWSRERHKTNWRFILISLGIGVAGFYEVWSHFLCK